MMLSTNSAPSRPTVIGQLALVLVCVACGCGETEQIQRYAVAKQAETPTAPRDDIRPAAAQPAVAWFLKLTGEADAVAAAEDDFRKLVMSTTFSGGVPEWSLPEGWSQESGTGMRYATLHVDGADPPLETSVIKLPYPGDREVYLKDNINRWRSQLGLAAGGETWRADAEAAGEVESLDITGQDITLVELSGKTEEIPSARMLAAILLPAGNAAAQSPAMRPPVASPAASNDNGPLTFTAPPEWKPGKKSVMRVAAFEVTDGDRKAEITVIPAGGDVLSNVNRWREQVGLEAWTDEELQNASEELAIDGQSVTFVDLAGSEQTILAAILPGDPQSWFFKLMGDPDLAKRETERFKAFVESVNIK